MWEVATMFNAVLMPLFAWTVLAVVICLFDLIKGSASLKVVALCGHSLGLLLAAVLVPWVIHAACIWYAALALCNFKWLSAMHWTEGKSNRFWYRVITSIVIWILLSSLGVIYWTVRVSFVYARSIGQVAPQARRVGA